MGIGYYVYSQGLSKSNKGIKMAVYVNDGAFICDYYVCCDKRSEFVYLAAGSTPVKGFTLSKKFLLEEIFPRYPEMA